VPTIAADKRPRRLELFMADPPQTPNGDPPHRGRVQAQGAGMEQSIRWAQHSPPTVRDVLRMLDELEGKLTRSEKRDREEAFRQAREFVRRVPPCGLAAVTKRSFPRNNRGQIRVDLEVRAGLACVPDDPDE
jgi:hypothetical protein